MIVQDIPPGLFREPVPAARGMHSLLESFITSGADGSPEHFAELLHSRFTSAPDPDLLLRNLLRFLERTVSKASLFNDLLRYPVVLDLLSTLFGSSAFFSDILVRDPGLFRWLTASNVLAAGGSPVSHAGEVERIETTFSSPERKLDALRRLHRRETLRIGSMDLLGATTMESATEQLSGLADRIIDAVVRIASGLLAQKFGAMPDAPFAVIGLGKLGGRELNYSSDIDILFVYGGGGEARAPGKKGISREEFFNKLAELVVQLLSQPTHEGYFYRVDVRLRPDAGAGPLARSLRSYLLYYESRGELWERQMLIKARPVGGDLAFGADFLKRLEPFVYPRTFFRHPAESVARIKARIEKSVGEELNIKLMRGGIRDIEFIVQTLQLINGGRQRSLRTGNTLAAIGSLSEASLLTREEAESLRSAYIFYRTVEHRLQTRMNTQTHTLPTNAAELNSIARQSGAGNGVALLATMRTHVTAVRSIFQQVFALSGGREEQGVLAIVDGGASDQTAAKILASFGLRDQRQALRHLRALASGSSLTGVGEHDARDRTAFREIAPDLFREIGTTPDPDLTLRTLAGIVSAQKVKHSMYTLLADPRFRRLLLEVCALSPRLSRTLAAHPLMLERLAIDSGFFSERPALPRGRKVDLVAAKHLEELRAGARNLLGVTSLMELTEELSAVADAIISRVLEEETRAAALRSAPFAVFALGKLGSREILFDADLDLLFLASIERASMGTRMERLGSSILRRLSTVSERGTLYEVDARLRPEGRNAPLVVDLRAYDTYLRERASLWERQTLTRLRFICGDERLGRRATALVEEWVYSAPLPAGWVTSTVGMRKRMETRSHVRGHEPLDIKLGPGGVADIEFLVQMMQLHRGPGAAGMRSKNIPDILEAIGHETLRPEERTALQDAYTLYRSIEKLMRLTVEERGSLLPVEGKLETLARCLDRSPGEELQQRVARTMKKTREIFLMVSKRLSSE